MGDAVCTEDLALLDAAYTAGWQDLPVLRIPRIPCGTSLVSQQTLGLSPSLEKRQVGFLLAFWIYKAL